ncbi:MAG: hypothetical protein HY554_10810 [Elusimicrobia bacterium]|nr:hypothetical protein [Elusimicrobiota bacterium]
MSKMQYVCADDVYVRKDGDRLVLERYAEIDWRVEQAEKEYGAILAASAGVVVASWRT